MASSRDTTVSGGALGRRDRPVFTSQVFHVEHERVLVTAPASLVETLFRHQCKIAGLRKETYLFLELASERLRRRLVELHMPAGEIAIPALQRLAEQNNALAIPVPEDEATRENLQFVMLHCADPI